MTVHPLFKIAFCCATAFVLMMAALPFADADPLLPGGGVHGIGGTRYIDRNEVYMRGPSPMGQGYLGSEYRGSLRSGAAGAFAGQALPGSGYYPYPYPASMPNCTDELQQERGAYSTRIGQRRFCY
jgi:hypothetical protein